EDRATNGARPRLPDGPEDAPWRGCRISAPNSTRRAPRWSMLENDPWLSDAIHFPTSNCEPGLPGAARLRCTDPGAFSWIGRLLSQRIKRRRSPGYEASLAFVKKMTIRYFISER